MPCAAVVAKRRILITGGAGFIGTALVARLVGGDNDVVVYDLLRRNALVRAGLGNRLMFGSDQMRWPEKIDEAIEAIEEADYLTAEQKRDILYNNAARFLRLEGGRK